MEFYHVLNRGVDRRIVVKDDEDRLRFLQGLFMYNDQHTLGRNARRKPAKRSKPTNRDLLVRIHAFCLMDNHYHLLLSPIEDNPAYISAFMRKLNMGYAKYFNEKYGRSGALWQGKYKSIHIVQDAHFLHIPYYIHLNPLDYTSPQWREGAVSDPAAALDFLRNYRWSSLPSYLGVSQYRSITHRTELEKILGSTTNQCNVITDIITDPRKAADSELLE